MKNKILWLALLSSLAFGETTLQFGDESNVQENEYGERSSDTSITVQTKDYKIDRFWHYFKKGYKNADLDVGMNTTLDFSLITRASFLCEKFGLEKEGCSGQKPLLINEGTLENSELQFDADGNPLPSDEYRIPFDSAENYDIANKDAFYALDIYRDMKYYMPQPGISDDSDAPTNFFGKLIAFFRDYFSHDVTVFGHNLNDPQARQRYIANLAFGAQQSYRMKKGETTFSTTLNSADGNNSVVSLLDYSEALYTNESGCDGLIFDYDPQSLRCKVVNFFSMTKWMPFIDSTDVTTVETKSVLEDTETTILTLAGASDGTSYVVPKLSEDGNGKKGFFGQIFKPVTYMMGGMYRFFFGDSSKNLTEIFSLNFNFNNPIALTLATTDGSKITGFEHFKLLGTESVYGTQVESCEVKLNDFDKFSDFMKNFFPLSTKMEAVVNDQGTKTKWRNGTQTFVKDSPKKVTFYKVLKIFMIGIKKKEVRTITADEWVEWCKRNQGVTKRGLLGRLTGSVSSFINDVISGTITQEYSSQDGDIDEFLNCGNSWQQIKETWSWNNQDFCFNVESYKEKVHKGLILHLKHIDVLDDMQIGTAGTHTEYIVKDIKRDGSAKSKQNKNHHAKP